MEEIGLGHVDSRHNVRTQDASQSLSRFQRTPRVANVHMNAINALHVDMQKSTYINPPALVSALTIQAVGPPTY